MLSKKAVPLSVFLSLSAVFVLSFQNCDSLTSLDQASHGGFASHPATSELQQKSLKILRKNCKSCHVNQDLGNIGNILDYSHLIKSSLIIPGDTNSRLLRAINDNSMPPGGGLLESEKLLIKNWILALGGLDQDKNPLDLNFDFSVSTDPQIFDVRYDKINYVLENNTNHLEKLKENKFLLGDYDYSKTITPNYAWGAQETKLWLQNIENVCSSDEIKEKYSWPEKTYEFVKRSLGRDISYVDKEIISDVNKLETKNSEKFEIFCLALLSSMEFVTK